MCITDSVRRFFQSKLDELSLKSKGMYDKKVQRQRRRNRIMKVCSHVPCVLFDNSTLVCIEIGGKKISTRAYKCNY